MKNIKINEENKEMYQKFYNIKKGHMELKHPILFGASVFSAIIILLNIFISGILPYASLIKEILTIIGTSSFVMSPIGMITTVVSSLVSYNLLFGFILLHFIPKTIYNIRLNEFQQEYPNFNIDIDFNELEKELKQTEKPTKISNELEKERHYVNFKEEFRQMNSQEKLDFLHQELEFWDKVSKEEKNIGFSSEITKENKQKTIGTIK